MKGKKQGAPNVVAVNTVNNYLQSIGVLDGAEMKKVVNEYAINSMGMTKEISHKAACRHIHDRFFNNFKQWAKLNYGV